MRRMELRVWASMGTSLVSKCYSMHLLKHYVKREYA